MYIRKNDTVVVITGNNKGKEGKVLKVFPKKERIIVEGVNIVKKHTRPSQANPQGGIIQKEASIHVSNVMLKCPKTGKPTRVGFSRTIDASTGRKKVMRISKKSGEMF